MVDYGPSKQCSTTFGFRKEKGNVRRLHFVVLFAGLITVSITILYRYPFSHSRQLWPGKSPDDHLFVEPVERCVSDAPAAAFPPVPVNLWSSLSVSEALEIRNWLESPLRHLNLTADDNPATSDNHIFGIEAIRPPKAESLAYLNSQTTVPRPKRFAKAIVHHGAARKPVIKEYLVGPLPVGPTTTISEVKGIYHREDIPFNARMSVQTELGQFIGKFMPKLAEATQVG